MKSILITGACGFVGFHLSTKFCINGYNVVGVDNFLSEDKKLAKDRLNLLKKHKNFKFLKIDLSKKFEKKLKQKFHTIIHLAAKPGVRESEINPSSYFKNNIVAFFNVIEFAKKNKSLFFYASSSSVYGDNQKKKLGTKENFTRIDPMSFYALTKEVNEKIAQSLCKDKFKCFGLRFFSVYGPYGRPDMAYYKFVINANNGDKIILNNSGKDFRDFTHITDIVNGIYNLHKIANKLKKHEIFNFGSNKPVQVKEIIKILKSKKKFKIKIVNKGRNNQDPYVTNADIGRAKKIFGYKPLVKFKNGYNDFLDWFFKYYKVI